MSSTARASFAPPFSTIRKHSSHLGKTAYEDRTQNFESLLDILQRAGLAVLWLDNQSGCKGVCDRVPNFQARQLAPGVAPTPLCSGGECFDLAMLHGLDERLAALPTEREACWGKPRRKSANARPVSAAG